MTRVVGRWVPKLLSDVQEREQESKSRFTEIMEKQEIFLDRIVLWYGSITTNQRLNSKVVDGSESMRVSPSKLRVLPLQANGWPPNSRIEREYCHSIGLQRKLSSTAITT